MAPTGLVIAVDAHVEDVQAVAARLREAGMTVKATHELIGTVTGWIDDSQVSALERVDGVASVERERSYELPPPDSPVQ